MPVFKASFVVVLHTRHICTRPPFFMIFHFINIARTRHGNSSTLPEQDMAIPVWFWKVSYYCLKHTGFQPKPISWGFLVWDLPVLKLGKLTTLAILTGTKTEVLRREVAPRSASGVLLWASQRKTRTTWSSS